MLVPRIQQQFFESADLQYQAADALGRPVADAAQALVAGLTAGGRVLAAGLGAGASLAQWFAGALISGFERERPGLPAVALTVDTSALTAIANDYSYDEVFSKQVEALGREGDALLALSTSGNSRNVIAAMKAARARGMAVVALTGRDGGEMARLLGPGDHHLNVSHPRTMRIQEVHILALHCLCDTIDNVLHGEK